MIEMVMESWRIVFRKALVPLLSDEALEALRKGLETDDPRLIQGATTTPHPLMYVLEWPVEAACLIGYGYWKGDGLHTVGEVEEAFARSCFEMDQLLGEPAGYRWLLNTYDDWPRKEMLANLLPEVELAIQCRKNMAKTSLGEYDGGHCVVCGKQLQGGKCPYLCEHSLMNWKYDDMERPPT